MISYPDPNDPAFIHTEIPLTTSEIARGANKKVRTVGPYSVSVGCYYNRVLTPEEHTQAYQESMNDAPPS